jgi:hypothetical protein
VIAQLTSDHRLYEERNTAHNQQAFVEYMAQDMKVLLDT